MKALIKIIANIFLLPLLPIRLGWRWSTGAKVTTKGALWNKHDRDGNEIYVEKGGRLPRLIVTAIIAGILYSIIGWGLLKILPMFGVQV